MTGLCKLLLWNSAHWHLPLIHIEDVVKNSPPKLAIVWTITVSSKTSSSAWDTFYESNEKILKRSWLLSYGHWVLLTNDVPPFALVIWKLRTVLWLSPQWAVILEHTNEALVFILFLPDVGFPVFIIKYLLLLPRIFPRLKRGLNN